MPSERSDQTSANLRQLFSELVRLETELWDAVEGRVRADHGVTLPFFEFMQIIARNPECRVQDIADELAITVGGTSKVVDRIEAAGYCLRHANPSDRRSSIIRLTPAGTRLLAQLTATVDDELRARLGSQSDRALAQLTKTLTALRTAVGSAEAGEQTG
jgi:MarR family transcriptional regulator, organic hydroperoxide resistance regulator